MRGAERACLAALLVAAAAAPTYAAEGRVVPQPHEWRGDVDVIVGTPVAYGIIDINYVYSFSPLLRGDVVVPRLRRFIRAPSEITAHLLHDNGPIDTRTTLTGGARFGLFDQHLYVGPSVGLIRNDVQYTRIEQQYYMLPLGLELTGRFGEMLQVGVIGAWRPIIGATVDTDAIAFAERTGRELEATLVTKVSTPGDRLLATLELGWWDGHWAFTGFHPGPMDAAGPRGSIELSYQISSTQALSGRFALRREQWDNQRLAEGDAGFVEGPLDRTVTSWDVQGTYHYWFRGRLGFRVTLGGGNEGEQPIFYSASPYAGDHPYGRIGFGFVTRY